MATGFYAVQRGRRPGIYRTWQECEKEISGFSGARFKKFKTEDEARSFCLGQGQTSQPAHSSKTQFPSSSPSSSAASALPFPPQNVVQSRKRKLASPPSQSESNALVVREGEEDDCVADWKIVDVYTDGASSNNGRQGACAGYGVHFPERPDLDESERLPGSLQTNNRGELLAIIRAIQINPDREAQLRIHTDSMYCVNAITQWQYTWRANSWQKRAYGGSSSSKAQKLSPRNASAASKAVLNRDLIRRLEHEMRQCKHRPILQHVKGHANSEGNCRADQLAVAGAAKQSCLPESEEACREPPPSDNEEGNATI